VGKWRKGTSSEDLKQVGAARTEPGTLAKKNVETPASMREGGKKGRSKVKREKRKEGAGGGKEEGQAGKRWNCLELK